jgi:hypothetical protein
MSNPLVYLALGLTAALSLLILIERWVRKYG